MVHLHVHSHYSVLDGLSTPAEIIERVKEIGANAFSICDHGNVNAFAETYKLAKKEGLKYIPANEFYIVDKNDPNFGKKKEKRYHFIALAKNWQGMQCLFEKTTLSNQQKFNGKPRLYLSQLFDFRDCFVSTACAVGLLNRPDYEEVAVKFHEAYKSDFYMEIIPATFEMRDTEGQFADHIAMRQVQMPYDVSDEMKEVILKDAKLDQGRLVNERVLYLAEKYDIRYVTTLDSHYATKECAEAFETLLCVQTRQKIAKPRDQRFFFGDDEIYIKDVNETFAAFKQLGYMTDEQIYTGIVNTQPIADAVDVIMPEFSFNLPTPYPDRKDEDVFGEKVMSGFMQLKLGEKDNAAEYLARLQNEVRVIKKLELMRYFLIVEDIMRYCRDNDIGLGPGRGSAGGSLVALCMGITKRVDPIKYGLFFERFLNESRVSMADIDFDVESSKRGMVLDYLKGLYGEDKVAQIATYGYLKPKSAFRDVCSVFSVPSKEVNRLSKLVNEGILKETKHIMMVPEDPDATGGKFCFFNASPILESPAYEVLLAETKGGVKIWYVLEQDGITHDMFPDCFLGKVVSNSNVVETYDAMEAFDIVPELVEFKANNPKIIELTGKLVGRIRNGGIHAAGIVTSDIPLNQLSVIENRGGGFCVNWDKKVAEDVFCLLKLDCLGLKTVDVIEGTLRLLREHENIHMMDYDIPLDDPTVEAEIGKGNTSTIFQFEGSNAKRLLKQGGDGCLDVLSAVSAMNRPGPLNAKDEDGVNLTTKYIECVEGTRVAEFVTPELEPILGDTYGHLCIHEDSFIYTGSGPTKIKNLKRFDQICCFNDDGRSTLKSCDGVEKTRFEAGTKLTLSNGFEVTLTDDHKVWTNKGWVEASMLNIDDHIVRVPREIKSIISSEPICEWLGHDIDVAYLIGQLIGDGACSGTGVTICAGSEESANLICDFLNSLKPSLYLNKYHNVRCWYVGISTDELEGLAHPLNRTTKLRHFVKRLGLNVTCYTKRIPKEMFNKDESVICSLIGGLWDSDGHISRVNGRFTCHYTSVNEELLQDISWLLHSIGIIHQRSGQRIHVWDIDMFYAKVRAFLRLKNIDTNGLESYNGYGSTLVETSELVKFMQERGLSGRALEREYGISRSRLNSKFIKEKTLRRAIAPDRDYVYVGIKRIEKTEECQFYGMSVDDHHNLIANGISVSNCYQEQIMKTVVALAGFTLPEADTLRKIIGKKLGKDALREHAKPFIDGCGGNGIDKEVARKIFDQIVEFAAYSFNLAHSVAYGIVSMESMWLKVNYPLYYFTSVLTFAGKDDKFQEYIKDAKRYGITVKFPSINDSCASNFSVKDGAIIAPLTAIKGVGAKAAAEIMRVREEVGGLFIDHAHFINSITEYRAARTVNVRVKDCLFKADAFECFGHVVEDKEERQDNLRMLLSLFSPIPTFKPKGGRTHEKPLLAELAMDVEECRTTSHQQPYGLVESITYSKGNVMVLTGLSKFDSKLLQKENTKWMKEHLSHHLGIPNADINWVSPLKCDFLGVDLQEIPKVCKDKCSREFLKREIEILRPRLIICCHSESFNWLIEDQDTRFMESMGNIYFSGMFDAYVVPGPSPQWVSYQDNAREMWNDEVLPILKKCYDIEN